MRSGIYRENQLTQEEFGKLFHVTRQTVSNWENGKSYPELQMLEGDDQPFCDIYGATSSSVLMEYLSPEEIWASSEEDLIAFLAEKSRNHIKDISKTADLLKKVARDSYRLDKALYEPLNVSIASSFNCIETFKGEIKVIGNAIEKEIKGLNPNAFIFFNLLMTSVLSLLVA